MSLNKKEIAGRFFTLFAVKNQTALAEHLGITPSVVTEWKKGRSAVPWEKLNQAVEEFGVTWDWLLLGRGEKYAIGTDDIFPSSQNNTPPTEASGEQVKNTRAIKAVFEMAGILVELGQHLADGKPLDAFLMPPSLRGTLQVLRERRRASRGLNKSQDQSGRTA